jgi:hypothetical protein
MVDAITDGRWRRWSLTGRVWTVKDSDDGDGTVIVPGMHYVNRLLYVVTENSAPEGQEIEVTDDW